jgi:hypothetical protein
MRDWLILSAFATAVIVFLVAWFLLGLWSFDDR